MDRGQSAAERFLTCCWRVLGLHRYQIADPAVSGEAGKQSEADVHHALGLRDHDGATSEAGEPVPLPGVVPLDAVGLVLAGIVLPERQEHGVGNVIVGAVEPGAPA